MLPKDLGDKRFDCSATILPIGSVLELVDVRENKIGEIIYAGPKFKNVEKIVSLMKLLRAPKLGYPIEFNGKKLSTSEHLTPLRNEGTLIDEYHKEFDGKSDVTLQKVATWLEGALKGKKLAVGLGVVYSDRVTRRICATVKLDIVDKTQTQVTFTSDEEKLIALL